EGERCRPEWAGCHPTGETDPPLTAPPPGLDAGPLACLLWLCFIFFPLCRTKLQYMNLKKYLKEICERQEMSLLRNQDLLREFDCFEQHIRKFASSAESLQKLKVGINAGRAMSRGLYRAAAIFMGRQMSARHMSSSK
uniref:Centrosomal protein kizuna n=1 Tax=Varanus komodoensis TaxID=61221 RepID=A0A8D2IUJ5_VARKO